MDKGNAGKPRILAFIIDNLFATIAAFIMIALFKPENALISGIAFSFTYLSYYLIFEALWSRTPGKFFQGLEVRRLDGSRCDLKASAIRTLLRVLEANPLLFGGLPAGIAILSSEKRQRLGDKLAGTIVVTRV